MENYREKLDFRPKINEKSQGIYREDIDIADRLIESEKQRQ